MPAAAARASLGKVSPASPRMSENTPLLSVDLPAELRQRQSELAQLLLKHCPSDGVYGTAVDPLAMIRADGPTLPAR
ncbi:AraC family transcriptional regulator CmrA, partial [Pseudomonas aeruginosa]|nr:AraC family transcriptional regulator CmrA [Pseudomonas aeruginosa]